MTVFEANLGVLALRHPGVARTLRMVPPLQDRGVWGVARSGVPTVRRDGVALVSAFDPEAEAARALAGDLDTDFLVLVGLGAGYLAEAALRTTDLPVVIAEASPEWFAEVIRHRDLSALWADPRVAVVLGPDAGGVGEFLGGHSCSAVRLLPWRPVVAQEPEWAREVEAQVARAQAQARVNLGTYQRFRTLWARNFRKNQAFAQDVRPLEVLRGLWEGEPVVIAAAGPSLGDSFPWMEAHRDRYRLIVVDTAWPAVQARGVVPDALVVLDGQYLNGRHVDKDPPSSTFVVTEWTGPPRAFRLAPGRTYVATSSLPFLRRREEARWGTLGALPTGGSVATAAWSLALHLGAGVVVFGGLDLGYPQGQTHAPASQFEEGIHRRSCRLCPSETLGRSLGPEFPTWQPSVAGGLVKSDPRMDLFRDWLAGALARRPDVPGFNLSRSGSLVPGLRPPTPDLGAQWPALPARSPGASPALVARNRSEGSAPFDVLEGVLGATNVREAVEVAWAAARAYWGPGAWDPWAGRAKATFDRFPSDRSRRALEEVIRQTLSWKEFDFP